MTTQTLIKTIQAGTLAITLTEHGHRLDELLVFASRLNPRRGYLFVSRVLGKHLPVRPSKMNAIHAELAQAIELYGDTAYVVGMAETAVGLGAGVARHLGQLHGSAVFHHTTRFLVEEPWIRIREAHSHADTMHMARLQGESLQAVTSVKDLVLVDDEISTGRTLAQLAHALIEQPELAQVQRLHIVSLVSWLDDEARQSLLSLLPASVDVRFVQLMAGTFTFEANPDYQAVLPGNVDVDFCDVLLKHPQPLPIHHHGLQGVVFSDQPVALPDDMQRHVPVNCEQAHATYVVYGMGEFLDLPFQLALAMEQAGVDVLFQSSTRSPIALGDDVVSKIENPAPGQPRKTHFLYNSPLDRLPLAFDGIGAPHLSQALEHAHQESAHQAKECFA